MTTETKHTPTPWIAKKARSVDSSLCKANINAAFIVHACNAHEGFVTLTWDYLLATSPHTTDGMWEALAGKYCDDDAPTTDRIRKVIADRLEQHLAKARGEA